MKTILKFFTLLVLTTIMGSCSKTITEPDLSKGYPEKFTNKISEKNLEAIKKLGKKINEGQDPPTYLVSVKIEEYVVESSDGSGRRFSEAFRLCWYFHQQAIVRVVGENTNKGEISIYRL